MYLICPFIPFHAVGQSRSEGWSRAMEAASQRGIHSHHQGETNLLPFVHLMDRMASTMFPPLCYDFYFGYILGFCRPLYLLAMPLPHTPSYRSPRNNLDKYWMECFVWVNFLPFAVRAVEQRNGQRLVHDRVQRRWYTVRTSMQPPRCTRLNAHYLVAMMKDEELLVSILLLEKRFSSGSVGKKSFAYRALSCSIHGEVVWIWPVACIRIWWTNPNPFVVRPLSSVGPVLIPHAPSHRWWGKVWFYHNQLKYEFDLEFDVPEG